MPNRRPLLLISLACLLGAWAALFLRYFVGASWAAGLPAWVVIVLLLVAAACAVGARGSARRRAGVWTALVLTGASLVSFSLPPAGPRMQENWQRESGARIAQALGDVGERIAYLEDASAALAARVTTHVRALAAPVADDPTPTFALLDSLAQAATRGAELTGGTAIGLQLFDAGGRRVAWAGWPQQTALLDAMFVQSGTELVYTRSVSLYQILSHVVPIRRGEDGEVLATLLVDLPLEVDYRVNNRFLKSTSLAEQIPRGGVARVSFDYFPSTGNLPERLPRFREQQAEFVAERARALAAARTHPAPAPAPAPDDSTAPRTPTRADSVLAYYPFPDNVEPAGEIFGDALSGLQGRVLVRSRVANPILSVTAVGHPLAHYEAQWVSRRVVWGRALALAALFALFFQAMRWTPRNVSARGVLARATLFTSFMVALRFALLSFGAHGAWARARLFDPSVFATPTLGGLLRSVFDLAVTALFLVILVYGLVRIVRARERAGPAAPPRAVARAGSVLAVAAIFLGISALVRGFVHTVVVNANPRLLGETMEITDPSLIVLHLGVFLMVTGILLAGLFLVWGVMRAAGETRRAMVCAGALAVVAAASALLGRWDPLGVSLLVALFVVVAPRVVHREDLVSVGIVAFCLVVVSSAAAYTYLARDYDELRKGFVAEKAAELVNPSDNWKVVILEDVLGDYAGRHEIRQALRSPLSQDIDRLAFDLWADGPLSLLGYSCAIHVVTDADSVVSEFAVDMPYRARIEEGGERTDTPDQDRWAVLDLTRSTPQGIVRFYRGILNVDDSDVYEETDLARRVIGKVIVDLPFFFGSLELAARTGPRTPEVLRNVQEGGVAPRVEEPEALLLARVDGGRRVMESSSERFAVGTRIPGDVMERARARAWPLLRTATGTYRVLARDLEESPAGAQETLLAGFSVPSPARHVLRWSTLFSLYLFFTLVMLLAVVALGAVPRINRVLPTLTPGGRLGFQQKLLASFLLVALAPAVILGLFSVDFIKGRFSEESREEASVKAHSARRAVANLLHGELQFYLARTDLAAFFAADAPRVQSVGGRRVVGLFADASAPANAATTTLGTVEAVSGDDLALVTLGPQAYVGVFSAPIGVSGDAQGGRYYVYYGRAVDNELLREIAEQVGADVNVYVDGDLVASSREGLLAGGFISATMNANAFVEVSLLGSERTLATERAGSYDFQVAYLPVAHWTRATADSAGVRRAATRAALAVPLLFRPESYSLEVQRATSVALGVFALLLAATIALGLVVARGVFEPMRELVAGTRRISQGDFNVRLREDRADEVGIVATAFNEMTERIAESQRALEERRRYLEAILENIGAGVISTDAEGRVRTVNAAAERIAGVAATAAAGRAAAEIAQSGHAGRIFALLDPAAAAMPFETGELEIERGGRRATIKYMRTRLESGGRYAGTVFVFEDLTELIESKKLSAWVEMARQIAHEIKNPLTPIRISTQFMRRAFEQKPEEFERIFREGTDTIIQQVDVLKRIAGEFSSFGRMQQLEVRPHAVDPLVRGIVAPYMNNSNNVRVRYENGAAGAQVVADAEAVRKICANLIENALEAMGPAGGELRVRCGETTLHGSPAVRIEFRDSGPGLNDEVARRLFEPYFSTKTTGTGLGLAICRTLSREMGGDVTIRNLENERGVEAALTLRRTG